MFYSLFLRLFTNALEIYNNLFSCPVSGTKELSVLTKLLLNGTFEGYFRFILVSTPIKSMSRVRVGAQMLKVLGVLNKNTDLRVTELIIRCEGLEYFNDGRPVTEREKETWVDRDGRNWFRTYVTRIPQSLLASALKGGLVSTRTGDDDYLDYADNLYSKYSQTLSSLKRYGFVETCDNRKGSYARYNVTEKGLHALRKRTQKRT